MLTRFLKLRPTLLWLPQFPLVLGYLCLFQVFLKGRLDSLRLRLATEDNVVPSRVGDSFDDF